MPTRTADQIRAYVNKAFIEPARRAGKADILIVASDVHADLKLDNRMPAVCSALDAKKFQNEYRVILGSRRGPRQGSTVTWRFLLQR